MSTDKLEAALKSNRKLKAEIAGLKAYIELLEKKTAALEKSSKDSDRYIVNAGINLYAARNHIA